MPHMTQGRNAWGRVLGLIISFQSSLNSIFLLYILLTTHTRFSNEGNIPEPIRSANHTRYGESKCGRIQETIYPSIFPTINVAKASVEILDPFTRISISFHTTSESTITAEL